MALSDLKLSLSYHSAADDIVNSLYLPCLKDSVSYQRITGFFSGMTFQILAQGLTPLITQGGKMKLIISTRLSQEDEEAIRRGYDERALIEHDMLDRIMDPTDEFEKGYLSLLTYLIANDILDIRVAVVRSNNPNAIEHEKIGIFSDIMGDSVVFSGSGNETPSGLFHNNENYDVYCSWRGDESAERCLEKQMYFNRLWKGLYPNVDTIPFPEAVRQRLFKYQDYLPKEELEKLDQRYIEEAKRRRGVKPDPLPSFDLSKLRGYQIKALEELKANSYRGYFDMATGTGKTLTALGGITQLVHDPDVKTKSFFCVIVVPYTHLAVQWEEDCKKFGMHPLMAFGNSSEWKNKFQQMVINNQLRITKFECVIITTASLLHDFVIDGLREIAKRTIFVADEAHNLGAGKISQVLDIDFRYRLGLSATMDRHHDSEGTNKLYDFFEKCCIHYDLGRAIAEGYLSHYRYYPVLVYLDDDEIDEYVKLSKDIAKRIVRKEDPDNSEGLKKLLLKRALLVAGCHMKIDSLKTTIKPYSKDYYSLVYCGAVSYYGATDPTEETQIKSVISMLHNQLHMSVERFTSLEDIETRAVIKEHFEEKMINAMVAIRCLDEGVNIPCIKRAFILASSTNPKEYIQRRGRVLRLFDKKEKQYAEIYDFITLTRPLSELGFLDSDQLRIEASLARRELARVEEFSRLADNFSDSFSIISDIRSAYRLDELNLEEDD